MRFWKRLLYLLPAFRRREERDMQAELASLSEMAAAGELGNLTLAAEARREVWGWTWLERLGQDIRYAARTMRRSPGFTATAVLSLALGIGANTAIFSLIDALMLRWLPVRDPQELVQLEFQTPDQNDVNSSFSYAIVRAFSAQRDIFAGVAGFSGGRFDVDIAGATSRVPGAWVTAGYYDTLGLTPAAGRLLGNDDDQPGAPVVAVISYGYWDQQFSRNPAAIGQTLRLNGVPVTIVGVSPPGFVGANVGTIAGITMPVAALPRISPEAAELLGAGNFWLRLLARPNPSISLAQAKARLVSLWPGIAERVIRPEWPPFQRKAFAAATFHWKPGGTGWTFLREIYRKPLQVLMAVVALVLLIACANVANLLLARATARQREIAVRLAIGAGRARIIRQLLTESTLLSIFGAAIGIELAWLSSRFLGSTISTHRFQVAFNLTPNVHVLAFTTAIAVATGILFGLAPAFQTTAAGPSPALKHDPLMSRSRSRLLSTLVSAQVALSLLLLIAAALFVRTLRNLQNLDPGFKREGVLLVDFEGRRTPFPQGLLDEIKRLPGIVSASFSTHTPLSGATWSEPAVPKGQPLPQRDNARFIGAGPNFFATLQTPLIAGREFTVRDRGPNPNVAIINEAFAQRYFSGMNPMGQYLSARVRGKPADLEIVGLVRSANLAGLRNVPPPAVYVSYAQLTGNSPTTLEIRASGNLPQTAAEIRRLLQPRLPGAPIDIHALTEQVNAAMVQERMMATLAGAFGVLALVLAAVGLYGLLAYGVARRTTEIGIRMALGAPRRAVTAMVVASAVRLVLYGVAIGLPMAWALSRWVKSMLFGLTPMDPPSIAGAALLLISAALIAAYLPARRASRMDPVSALRHE